MNRALVDKVADAVLYEGYLLYPYRPSAVKNRQRWTFGGVFPQVYSLAQGGSDAWTVQTECLVEGDARTLLTVRLRFLHLLARQVGELAAPLPDLPAGVEPSYRPVAALQVGDQVIQSWQEAVEREVATEELELGTLLVQPHQQPFSFPAWRALEALRAPEPDALVCGVLVREQQPIDGLLEVRAVPVAAGVFKVGVQIANLTPLEDAGKKSRDEALLHAFVSTHAILGVRDGAFVSLLDPPEPLRAAAADCRNAGLWPVLVGEAGARDLLLASPIILYDYPQVAPESPGDLFDGTEIDELLTLRIMTMTEEEKREMSTADERARALLERTESLAREQLLRLHGTIRSLRPLEEEP